MFGVNKRKERIFVSHPVTFFDKKMVWNVWFEAFEISVSVGDGDFDVKTFGKNIDTTDEPLCLN